MGEVADAAIIITTISNAELEAEKKEQQQEDEMQKAIDKAAQPLPVPQK
jgi:hypothetical protein